MSSRAPRVEQYMSHVPHTIERDATLQQAHQLMREHRIRHLPVLEGGALVGMVSRSDLHLIESLKDVEPAAVPVEDAMTAQPYTVAPDAGIDEVAAHMAAERIGSAVVVDAGRVVGVFTTTDALMAFVELSKQSR
jgi:acetoin utilization protein AcuB